MTFKSELFEIDPETGDIKRSAKRTLRDYLSRRTRGIPESRTTTLENGRPTFPVGTPDDYTYTPEDSNTYPIASNGEDQKKFASEFEINRLSAPTTLPITRGLMAGALSEDEANLRKNKNEFLKDIIPTKMPEDINAEIVGNALSAIEAISNGALQNRENLAEDIKNIAVDRLLNPISISAQVETGLKIKNNRFTTLTEPRNKNVVANDEEDLYKSSTNVSKSTVYKGHRQQAISHRLASDMSPVLLPSSLLSAMDTYGKNNPVESIVEKLKGETYSKIHTDKNKIDANEVEKIENTLESQYMPFYIQDLRTNEILNFHAFVENVSDSYTANWNDSEGYGRMDPVQTYKNTTRSIGVDFYIVSTSDKDFDRVWWTINRLIMMIYPQWSRGTTLKNSDDAAFIQPFSQTITSSPIVRLRVGDLISSNYSRFNLARNFGLGVLDTSILEEAMAAQTNAFNADAAADAAADASTEKYLDTLKDATLDQELSRKLSVKADADRDAAEQAATELRRRDLELGLAPSAEFLGNTRKNFDDKNLVKTSELQLAAQGGYLEIESKVVFGNTVNCLKAGNRILDTITKPFIQLLSEPDSNKMMVLKGTKGTVTKIKKNIGVVLNNLFSTGLTGATEETLVEVKLYDNEGTVITNYENLYFLGPYVMNPVQQVQQVDTPTTKQFGTSAQLNLRQPENSIVRSFQNSYGRGLAGSIRSIGLDWGEAPWETAPGSRAPIWCKINISFNPIHDLPMGLDHDGAPRAVPYPVGDIVRETFFPELHQNTEIIRNKIKKNKQ